jgi:nitrile hydratase
MNGIHDLGGMHGFGPIDPDANQAGHDAAWEPRVAAINSLLRRGHNLINIDEFRHGIERMAPAHYLTASYYERWLETVVTNLLEKGVLTADELAARTRQFQAHPATPIPNDSDPALRERLLVDHPVAVYRRPVQTPPRFGAGDRVRARNVHPTGHTRLPRYVRGKVGQIEAHHGAHVFPDTNAHGRGEQPQALYTVRFTGQALWGPAAEPGQELFIDLFEPYLEPA